MDLYKKLFQKAEEGYFKELYREAKWMCRYIRRYWLSVCFYIIMGVLGTLAGFGSGIASKYLIDAVTGHKAEDIGTIIVLMLGMALGNILTKAFVSRISARITVTVQNEIQAEMFDKIIYTDWQLLYQYKSGDLLNRLSGDVGIMSNSVINWIPDFITRTVQFLGALGIILYYDVTMAVIALLSAPVTLLISRYLIRRMRNYNKEMREISSEMMAFENDSFQNLQTLKAFDLMGSFSAKMREIQYTYKEKMMNYNKFSIYISSFMSIVGMIVSYACFGWGVYRLWSGAITYGTMTLFLQMSSSVSASFSALVKMFPSAISALTSAGRLMSVTELPKEEVLDDWKIAYMREHKTEGLSVVAEKIEVIYREGNLVFSNGSIVAEPGELVAVIGPSGEGKTTMIRLLLGLLKPSVGSLTLRTKDGHACRVSAGTREFFAYVPQGNTVFSGTIADNLRMVKPDATEEEMLKALEIGCAYEFVMNHPKGLLQEIGEKGVRLSEGQAQRIAIARAMLRNAPILLLDEATSALDMEIEEQVLENLMKNRGNRTCIITTHRPSVLAMCNHIYEMKANTLIKIR